MSNYPDDFSSSSFRHRYEQPDPEYPTFDEIHAIARKHFAVAVNAIEAEIKAAGSRYCENPFTAKGKADLIEWCSNDSLIDALDDAFVKAVRAEE